MIKKIFAVFLTLAIIFCVAFECSLNASAVVLADDAVLLILATSMSLISWGITIQNVSEFASSDLYQGLCREISYHFDQGVARLKKGAVEYIAFNKALWGTIGAWVKSRIVPGRNTVQVETSESVTPSSITLKNGSTVPYGDFMENPFFIYQTTKFPGVYAWYCSGSNPGVNFNANSFLVRMWCTGSGTVYRYELVNGAWSEPVTHQMNYGLTYKGVPGSFYDLNFNASLELGQTITDIMQYRTMDLVTDTGVELEQTPPNEVPEDTINTTANVVLDSDPVYYPGAVDSPAEILQEGDQVLIEIPDEVLVDNGAGEFTFTSNPAIVEAAISSLTPSTVKPKVLTNAASGSVTVEQVITNTPAETITTTDSNAAADIETTNKFRLPKSFLEGFPFSIPYSIFLGLQSFVADPEAPSFDLPFSIPRLGIDETVTLDLAQFNPLARLCRALLSLVWVAGLAMACNAWIKR